MASAMTPFGWWLVLIGIAFALVQLRNRWVYNKRMDVLYRSAEDFYALPSYNAMMVRFWIWDVGKFAGQTRELGQ